MDKAIKFVINKIKIGWMLKQIDGEFRLISPKEKYVRISPKVLSDLIKSKLIEETPGFVDKEIVYKLRGKNEN